MNTNRIAINTVFLYLRMFIILLITLYSSRLLLKNLGIIDFGVYNVVYGLVLFFSFMNGTLTSGTQRFLNYAMGIGDKRNLEQTFMSAYTNHLLMACLILLIVFIIGNIMIFSILELPSNRILQSCILFNLSSIYLFVTIITIPFQSVIIAHEEMRLYAYYSIIESFLKLISAALLIFFSPEYRIPAYGMGILLTAIIIYVLYRACCLKLYEEVKCEWYWEKNRNVRMLCFSGWDTFGWGASACAGQGVNVLLNLFGGPVLNAARGVSVQVYSMFNQLINSFQNAINPQIVKSYAKGVTKDTYKLLSWASKMSLVLSSIVAVPIYIGIDIVLRFWLGEYPDYSVEFSRIMIIQSMVVGFTRPIVNALHATGNIKYPCVLSGLVLFLTIPISWVMLSLGISPVCVLIVNIFPWVVEGLVNLLFLHRYLDFNYNVFLLNNCFRPVIVLIVSFFLSKCLFDYIGHSFEGVVITFFANLLFVTTLTIAIAFDKEERCKIIKWLKR